MISICDCKEYKVNNAYHLKHRNFIHPNRTFQVAEVCLASRERTGGLVALDEVIQRVTRMRGSASQAISKDDVERAVGKLKALSDGFKVVGSGSGAMIQSVPGELSGDHNAILQLAEGGMWYRF